MRSSRCHCPHTTPPCQPHPPLIAQHPEHLSQPWSRPELTTCPAPAPRPKQCPSPTCACVAAQDMGSSHHQPTVTTRMRLCARAGSLRCRCVRRHLLAASTRADVLWSFALPVHRDCAPSARLCAGAQARHVAIRFGLLGKSDECNVAKKVGPHAAARSRAPVSLSAARHEAAHVAAGIRVCLPLEMRSAGYGRATRKRERGVGV